MNIIEKLGITPGPWVVDGNDINYLGDPDIWYRVCQVPIHRKFPGNLNLISAIPEILEALVKIIKIQNDPRESLSNLNGAIRNAENMLIDKFPEIKELLS